MHVEDKNCEKQKRWKYGGKQRKKRQQKKRLIKLQNTTLPSR
jgi:hypothetical protein